MSDIRDEVDDPHGEAGPTPADVAGAIATDTVAGQTSMSAVPAEVAPPETEPETVREERRVLEATDE